MIQVATTIDGATYVTGAGYDANSRLVQVSYPSGFTARYGYNMLGYANQFSDSGSGQLRWSANAMESEGHLTVQTAGTASNLARLPPALPEGLFGRPTECLQFRTKTVRTAETRQRNSGERVGVSRIAQRLPHETQGPRHSNLRRAKA